MSTEVTLASVDLGKVVGDAGAAATIAVGTVQTGAAGSNAQVTNSGTTSAAVFDFVIPRGADGAGTIPDDSITGRNYVLGAANGVPYIEDNQTPSVVKILMTLTQAHSWTETT